MRRTHLVACAAAIAAVMAPAAQAKPPDVDSTALERAVTVQGIVEHQRALQSIANLNGGTRHTETPGYAASVAYGDDLGPAGPPGSGVVEDVFKRYFDRRGMATLPQAFDGRSDYVGFINRGIPGGGIFAGAEVRKTAEQVAVFGGVAGEQYDPCYHEACDNIGTVTGQPPASTMNSFPTDPALAQRQADSLNGNALKSLREMSGAVTHAVWYFARAKAPFGG
jgi:hypothetical protein